jgi:hypothetical protein
VGLSPFSHVSVSVSVCPLTRKNLQKHSPHFSPTSRPDQTLPSQRNTHTLTNFEFEYTKSRKIVCAVEHQLVRLVLPTYCMFNSHLSTGTTYD